MTKGADNPDRDAQFCFTNEAVETALAENQPVISVDTKKKELVGDFKNAGREWRPQGDPEEVRVHDFLIEERNRGAPYGVYDLAANTGSSWNPFQNAPLGFKLWGGLRFRDRNP